MSQVFVSAVAVGVAIVLHGCGGSGDTTTPGPSTPSGTTESTSTTTTSTTTPAPAPITGLICSGSEQECVDNLNQLYRGFDQANEASSLGVPIRGRPRFDEDGQWYYCTGKCYDNDGKSSSQPDCYTAGGLINHKIMITEEGKIPNSQNSKSGKDAFFARYNVLIVLQPETALTRLTKCAWQFDGAAFGRQNGGCGMGALKDSCQDPESAYNDKCPDDQNSWANESCAYTMQGYCGNASVDYSNNCFWKGPAFESPVYPGAEPDFDFSDWKGNDEIRQMLKNRVSDNHQNGSTEGGLPLLEYWNEITMDGRIIKHFEDTQGIKSVIAAVAFVRGNEAGVDAQSQAEAQKFIDYFKNQSVPVDLPLLVLDSDAAPGTGPFMSVSAASLVV